MRRYVSGGHRIRYLGDEDDGIVVKVQGEEVGEGIDVGGDGGEKVGEADQKGEGGAAKDPATPEFLGGELVVAQIGPIG